MEAFWDDLLQHHIRFVTFVILFQLVTFITMYNRDDIKKKIIPILKKYGIKKAGIFGSTARGDSVVNDLDLLVKIDRKISLLEFIGIQQELEDELGMKVDLVEYQAIKPSLKDDILRDEEPVL
jgi:uncharacterized protein